MWKDEFGRAARRMEPSCAAPEPATRSRFVLDTRVSRDDSALLVVRYSNIGHDLLQPSGPLASGDGSVRTAVIISLQI
jgi:hypothetical protein